MSAIVNSWIIFNEIQNKKSSLLFPLRNNLSNSDDQAQELKDVSVDDLEGIPNEERRWRTLAITCHNKLELEETSQWTIWKAFQTKKGDGERWRSLATKRRKEMANVGDHLPQQIGTRRSAIGVPK
ncbi:hypothetical protein QE152_g9523 [Popillia japonica]|uniref:Uncharacterized protein n=1 Tax=Popillia japonica TaxID=7064 RepID=A0AAW1LXK3_POPJA